MRFAALVLALSVSTIATAAPPFRANIRSFYTQLPLIHVNTNGKAVTAEEVEATVTIFDGERNSASDLLRSTPQHQATINVRGYSSAKFAKKQFDLVFHEDGRGGEDKKVGLLGFPAHHKWVLGAPYLDRVLIRNNLAFGLANQLTVQGEPWYAPRAKSFELFINGQYRGVYLLTEKVDGSKSRVNLGKVNWETPEESPYMLKVEKSSKLKEGESFDTPEKSTAAYYEPKAKKLNEMRKKDPEAARRMDAHIQKTFNRFEASVRAIEAGDVKSYRAVTEPETFQNYILIQELFKNLDGYRRSMFVQYKGGKLHMGPVWDFDLTLGGFWVFSQKSPKGFQVGHNWYIDGNPEIFWFRTMLKDPAFQRDTVKRYRALRRAGQPLSTANVLGQLDRMTGELREASARNFTVWDPNGQSGDGPLRLFIPKYRNFVYAERVAEVKRWVLERLEWLDENMDEIGK